MVFSPSSPSYSHYLALWTDPYYREAIMHSLLLSFSVAVFSLCLCMVPAWLFATRDFPGKSVLRSIYALPLSFSGILVGFLMILLFGRIGLIPRLSERFLGYPLLSGLAYHGAGLWLAYLYFEIPRATLSLESALSGFDTRLPLAAKSLGAKGWQVFFWVILPNIKAPLVSTLAITFSASLGSFGVALILSRRFTLLPVEIYRQIAGFQHLESAAAMTVFLVMMALTINLTARLGWSRRESSGEVLHG